MRNNILNLMVLILPVVVGFGIHYSLPEVYVVGSMYWVAYMIAIFCKW